MAELPAQVIFDGKLQPASKAAVPVTARGLLYGEGCFETFRSYKGRFLKLNEHLKRLGEGLEFLDIPYPEKLKAELLISLLKTLLQVNNAREKDAVIRLQVWREGKRGYKINKKSRAHFSITVSPFRQQKEPCRLATVAIRRIPSKSLPSKYKLSGGINYIIASQQAREKQADDALLRTIDNHVSETAIANIFWVKGGVVYTPSIDCDILPGITRRIVLQLLKEKLKVKVKEGAFRIEAVKSAESVFLCNSIKEVAPVREVDEASYNAEAPLFIELANCFQSFRNEHLSE